MIGDPKLDTEVYGVLEDISGAQIFWGVGWENGLGSEWMMFEWDVQRAPLPSTIKDIFSILDEPDIEGTLSDDDRPNRPTIIL